MYFHQENLLTPDESTKSYESKSSVHILLYRPWCARIAKDCTWANFTDVKGIVTER